MDPVLTFNWVFENQPIINQESILLADEKGPQQGDPGIYLGYTSIFMFYLE